MRNRWILLLLILTTRHTLALPSDSKQRIYIYADTSYYNYKTGKNIFEGNVRVDQGTTHITADKLVTQTNQKHRLKEAVAYGKNDLAHYWTISKQSQPEIHAYAKVIKFYPIQANVTLESAARVIQGKNSFQGELIHYNSNDQTITVPRSTGARAVIIYNPDK